MGQYITQADIELRLSPRTVLAIFDDDNDGVADADAVAAIIDDAEAHVDAALLGFIDMPAINPADRLIKRAALNFAIAFSFERHPEYVRSFGEEPRIHYKRAEDYLDKIQAARRRLPDNNSDLTVAAGGTVKNVGGIVTDSGPRTLVDDPDGTQNSGDF